jgi:glyoxylase I family protein
MTARGIPGLMGTEHVGFTVPDLEEAVAFFRDVIGCDFIFDGGAVGGDPDLMTRQLGVHPDATVRY